MKTLPILHTLAWVRVMVIISQEKHKGTCVLQFVTLVVVYSNPIIIVMTFLHNLSLTIN